MVWVSKFLPDLVDLELELLRQQRLRIVVVDCQTEPLLVDLLRYHEGVLPLHGVQHLVAHSEIDVSYQKTLNLLFKRQIKALGL